jgi:predicted RNA-binding protein YlqC (UPF0109 family)
MAKRIHNISKSLNKIGDLHVNDWELPEVFSKDISELEIRSALERLGNIHVTDWELKDAISSIQHLAQKEVDIAGFLKHAADYKLIDWDFREALGKSKSQTKLLSDAELQEITGRLLSYLEFVIKPLIKQPKYASFHVEEIAPQVLSFKIVLKQRDLSALIGMNGLTAGPIRRILKDVALKDGVYALLRLQSIEDAMRVAPK